VRAAVAEVVRQQAQAGIDIVTDGEQGKPSFFGYVMERFDGFERRPPRPGQEGNPRSAGREHMAFPDYYAWPERIAEWAGGRGGDRRHGIDTRTGAVAYKGQALVRAGIETLKAAVAGLLREDARRPSGAIARAEPGKRGQPAAPCWPDAAPGALDPDSG
jgi:5-methyltetrahydropteroyltriglutamate--homocysteine methyltransferase